MTPTSHTSDTSLTVPLPHTLSQSSSQQVVNIPDTHTCTHAHKQTGTQRWVTGLVLAFFKVKLFVVNLPASRVMYSTPPPPSFYQVVFCPPAFHLLISLCLVKPMFLSSFLLVGLFCFSPHVTPVVILSSSWLSCVFSLVFVNQSLPKAFSLHGKQ